MRAREVRCLVCLVAGTHRQDLNTTNLVPVSIPEQDSQVFMFHHTSTTLCCMMRFNMQFNVELYVVNPQTVKAASHSYIYSPELS